MAKNLHLEHIEDLMLMFGEEGVKESFAYIDDLVQTFSGDPKNSRKFSTKWDGSPAIFCGPDPEDGQFFVAKKGIFNKNPQLFKSVEQINEDKIAPGLKKVFEYVFKYMKPLYDNGKLKDVVQGDFLYHEGTRKVVRDVHGEDCVIFKPQLISYCIPDHDTLYDTAKACKVCVVIHAKYPNNGAKSVADLSVNFGFDASDKSTKDLLILSPFTSELGRSSMITNAEKTQLMNWKRTGSRLLPQCADFLNEIAPSHDDPWGLAYFLKQYFNAKVRQGQAVSSAARFYQEYCNYWEEKFRKKIGSLKQAPKIAEWKAKMYAGMDVLEANKRDFLAMVALYNTIQNIKNIFVPKLEAGERFRTYYYDEKTGTYEVGNQEGYVAIRESTNAVKLVQRLGGFSQRNFEEIKSWAKK
jgi:hypothetical protein